MHSSEVPASTLAEIAKKKDETDLLRKAYRGLVARCLNRARTYDGTERSLDSVVHEFSALEDFFKEHFTDSKPPTVKQERALSALFHKEGADFSISNLLDICSRTFKRKIGHIGELEVFEAEQLHIHTQKLPGIILPSGEGEFLPASAEVPKRQRAPHFIDLFTPFLLFLQEHHIFLDDLSVFTGSVEEAAFRRKSYMSIEIPRLQKTVLLCNQAEEATFVVHGLMDRASLLQMSKEELMNLTDVQVTRVPYSDLQHWSTSLEKELFSEKVGPKINIKDSEVMRQSIQKLFNVEAWLDLSIDERIDLKIDGKKIVAIGKMFGVNGNIRSSNSIFYDLTGRIFGHNHTELQKLIKEDQEKNSLTKEKAKELITSSFTLEQFMNLSRLERDSVKIQGVGLKKIATWFGIEGNPVRQRLYHLQLTKAIFGNSDALLNEQLENELKKHDVAQNPQSLRERLLVLYTPQIWVNLTQQEIKSIKIDGLAIRAIGVLLGCTGNPQSTRRAFLELGLIIFGENGIILQELQKLGARQVS